MSAPKIFATAMGNSQLLNPTNTAMAPHNAMVFNRLDPVDELGSDEPVDCIFKHPNEEPAITRDSFDIIKVICDCRLGLDHGKDAGRGRNAGPTTGMITGAGFASMSGRVRRKAGQQKALSRPYRRQG